MNRMTKTKRPMTKRHEPHIQNSSLFTLLKFPCIAYLILLYSLSAFPVCLNEMVSTGNAEGQYALFAESVGLMCGDAIPS
jgi:hypothetical protein